MAEDRPVSRREEYAEITRLALIEAAIAAFAEHGFRDVGIEAISRAARVTRGAFYHHFEDKPALFDAVVVALQRDAAAKIEARAKTKRDIWQRLHAGIEAFLDVSLEPAYRRIVVQDASAVLGPARFREIEDAHPMALLIATLAALKARGELAFDDIHLLAGMVDAMINRLAMILPDVDDPATVRRRGTAVIADVLETYRAPLTRRR